MDDEPMASPPDDGEASSDSSPPASKHPRITGPPSDNSDDEHKKHHRKHRHKHKGLDDEEARLRRRLLEKHEKKGRAASDEEEMFTIQPHESKPRSAREERDPKRERDRYREEKKDERRVERRDDRRDDRRDPRHRGHERDSGSEKWKRKEEEVLQDDRSRRKPTDSRDDRHKNRPEKEEIRKRSRSRSSPPHEQKKPAPTLNIVDAKKLIVETAIEEHSDEEAPAVIKDAEMEAEEILDQQLEAALKGSEEPVEETTAEPAPEKKKRQKEYKFEDSDEEEEIVEEEPPESPGYDDRTPSEASIVDEEVLDESELVEDTEGIPFSELTEEQKGRLSPSTRARRETEEQKALIVMLPYYFPGISGCRNVAEFDCLNRIEEGTFGVVYRAKDKRTDEVVALKRLKMEKEKEGFPITSLREVNMLLKAGTHPNVVNVREVVIGSNMDKIYLVMEYVEHDMKSLMEGMYQRKKYFKQEEVKTLMQQLLAGCQHMHDLWILHRDLKTSNLLLSHKGILKIGDFGLAREYGDPLKPYTSVVVTLWYRSPELLLGKSLYSTAVDMWSVGCIMGEFITLKPIFPGKGEMDELDKIFNQLGTPSDTIWPEYSTLPGTKMINFKHYQFNQIRGRFPTTSLAESGFQLLNKFLTYDPDKRISAEDALKDAWFTESPKPVSPELFPTFPAKSELGRLPPREPKEKPPAQNINPETLKLLKEFNVKHEHANKGFSLQFDSLKFK